MKSAAAGSTQALVLAPDEVYVRRSGAFNPGDLRRTLESNVPGAQIFEKGETHALVRLNDAVDATRVAARTDVVSRAVPTAEVLPVYYEKGLPKSEASRRIATSEVSVKLAGRSVADVVSLAGAVGSRPAPVHGWVTLKFADPYSAIRAAENLAAQGLKAQPEMLRQAVPHAAIPHDKFFTSQWHLSNTGQGGGLPGEDLNVLGAWDVTLGAPVNVTVVDDSVQVSHPDLQINCPPVSSGAHYDFADDDTDPSPEPFTDDAHGTSVSGIIAAKQDNGNPDENGYLRGVSGVAPNAHLLGIRIIGHFATDSDFATALTWDPLTNRSAVSNNSWGYRALGLVSPGFMLDDALRQATEINRDGRGQATFFAAGNSGDQDQDTNFSRLANSRFVGTVAGVDFRGKHAFYSTPGASVLVSAPTQGNFSNTLGIVTTDDTGISGYNPSFPNNLPDTNYTNSFNGTSAATPMISGVAALMISANAQLGWRDVKEILAMTARQNDDPKYKDRDYLTDPAKKDASNNLFGREIIDPVTGAISDYGWATNEAGFAWSHVYGAGVADAEAAVKLARNWDDLPSELSQTVSMPITGAAGPTDIPDDRTKNVIRTFSFTDQNLRLEQIEVKVKIKHDRRSDLDIQLVSPSGKISRLYTKHVVPDPSTTGDNDKDIADGSDLWTFTTNHHWGENSQGDWKLYVRDLRSGAPVGKLLAASMTLWGTPAGKQRFTLEKKRYEVGEGDGTVKVTVKRLGGTAGRATVDYLTIGGSASQGPDYDSTTGTLEFLDGEASKDISIKINEDDNGEGPEHFHIALRNPVLFAGDQPVEAPDQIRLGGAAIAQVTIVDNEQNIVEVTAEDQTAAETDDGETPDTGTFLITRSIATPSPMSVSFLLGGTASMGAGSGGDYAPVQQTVTIPPYEKSVRVEIIPRNDSEIEGSETVVLTLVSGTPTYVLGSATTATVTLLDNDRPKVQITTNDREAKENPELNDFAKVTISRNADLSRDLNVVLRLEGTQVNGQNYELIESDGTKVPGTQFATVTIPSGSDHIELTVKPIADSVYQATKLVVIRLFPTVDYEFGFGFLTAATIRISEDDPVPNTVIPRIVLQSPAPNARILAVEGTAVTASGVASDDQNADHVEFRVNNGPWRIANITHTGTDLKSGTWTADISSDLVYGVNALTVRSVDDVGNQSKVISTSFTYVREFKLTTAVTGSGSISLGIGDKQLEAGKAYTVVATPGAGQLFNGWSGLSSSLSKKLTFTMPPSNSTLTAAFATNPFAANAKLTGSFTGLVKATEFAQETSGFIRVLVSSGGAFTGQLQLGGVTYPLRGDFTASGAFSSQLVRKNSTPVTLNLAIDTANPDAQRITGSVVSSAPTFSANIVANRTVYSRSNPLPEALVKSYTLLLPPPSPIVDTNRDPRGTGYGTAKIDAAGMVRWNGVLADGTRVSQATPISKDGTWPLFASLYSKHGVILGTMTHADVANKSDFSGSLDWFKPTSAKSKSFPLGFRVVGIPAVGSVYTAPAADQRVLAAFNTAPDNSGVVGFEEGNLQAAFSHGVTLGTDNKVTVAPPNSQQVAVRINAAKGTFSGSFIHSASGKKTTFNGVVFQKQQRAAGLFIGPVGQSGTVTLLPNPSAPTN